MGQKAKIHFYLFFSRYNSSTISPFCLLQTLLIKAGFKSHLNPRMLIRVHRKSTRSLNSSTPYSLLNNITWTTSTLQPCFVTCLWFMSSGNKALISLPLSHTTWTHVNENRMCYVVQSVLRLWLTTDSQLQLTSSLLKTLQTDLQQHHAGHLCSSRRRHPCAWVWTDFPSGVSGPQQTQCGWVRSCKSN